MAKDDEERTRLEDTSHSRIAVQKLPQTIDEQCENIKGSGGMIWFKFIKYDTLGIVNKAKIEEAFLDMMETFKYTPLESSNLIPNELYNKINSK